MIATVTKIDLHAKHNGKDYVLFVTQGQPYKGQAKPPREHKLFRPYADALIKVVETLAVGDTVEYTCDASQYKNMNSVEKVAPQQAPAAGGGNTGGGNRWKQDDDVTKRIARAASMKEAVALVLFTAKKTDDIQDLIGQVKAVTTDLELFLQDATNVAPAGEEEQEEPFK